MSMILTNPIFIAKVVSYDRLAYSPKDVWFREYELFPDKYSLLGKFNLCHGCFLLNR